MTPQRLVFHATSCGKDGGGGIIFHAQFPKLSVYSHFLDFLVVCISDLVANLCKSRNVDAHERRIIVVVIITIILLRRKFFLKLYAVTIYERGV